MNRISKEVPLKIFIDMLQWLNDGEGYKIQKRRKTTKA